MKRTTLMLDESLLNEATAVLGAKTYSGAINLALAEAIRTAKIRGIAKFFGSDIWDGSLSEMREDRKLHRNRDYEQLASFTSLRAERV